MSVIARRGPEAGLTLPELLIAISIGVMLAGLSVAGIAGLVKTTRADGGLADAITAFQSGRELSVSDRRNVQMIFTAPNTIELYRVELPSGTTLLRTIVFEGRVEFRTFSTSGMPDTPMAFGNSSAVSFGSNTPVMYTTDGSFIDSNGDVLNGTLFIGVANEPLSARAITVLGATGAVTGWVWDGRAWQER